MVRGATQVRRPLNKKPVGVATGKGQPHSLLRYSRFVLIPFTLVTAVCPFEASRHLSLQQLRGPFNNPVCTASQRLPLSVTPCECLLFLINVFVYLTVAIIIGKFGDMSRGYEEQLK